MLFRNTSETVNNENVDVDEEGEEKIAHGPDKYVFFVDLYQRYLVLIKTVFASEE